MMNIDEIKSSVDKFYNKQGIYGENYYPVNVVERAIKLELIALNNILKMLQEKYNIKTSEYFYWDVRQGNPTFCIKTNKGECEFFIKDYVDKSNPGNALYHLKSYDKYTFLKKKWNLSDEDIEKFLNTIMRFYTFFENKNVFGLFDYLYLFKTNVGLNIRLSFSLSYNSLEKSYSFNKVLSDGNFESTGVFLPPDAPNNYVFIFRKDLCDNHMVLKVNNNEIYNFLDESSVNEIANEVLVDISSFSLSFQERIKQCNSSVELNFEEDKIAEVESIHDLERNRIMQFYTKFSEFANLINNVNLDMDFKKIKFNELEKIIFKSYGFPNALGYIEFEDFFKNNMVLRMIDLSTLDLTNVDIRGIDFSGTNIHINPQTIYNKDMTNVNATNVKFSPFLDSFDGVILDGAIINDHEANINLDRVKSYNENTRITDEDIIISFK